ncbi:MAG: nucleotidyltransferase domain-containing protein [Syntrophales bacterium]|nr:nucleotidyltransferase domain-containing protein [Syntrophales bacterium]
MRERFHVMEVGIFGPFIKGEETALSDIDILVTFERGHKDFFNYMRMKDYLAELIGIDILRSIRVHGQGNHRVNPD